MNPRVTDVRPSHDYTLILTFDNGEVRVFDVSPYLDKGLFQQLTDRGVFKSVRPFLGSIQWCNGLDLCPDTLYLDSMFQTSISSGTGDEELMANRETARNDTPPAKIAPLR